MGQKTFNALMERGFDSETANRLEKGGYTLSSLTTLDEKTLSSLNISEELLDIIRKGKRPPIPSETMNKLLFESGWACCVCGKTSGGIIVHHIEKYSESHSHDEDNLVVLCLNHHGEAHTKRELGINLTPDRLRASKKLRLERVKQLHNREPLSANPEYSYESINQIAHSVTIVTAPVMSLQFADHETRQELGNSMKLSSIAYVETLTPLPDTQVMQWRDIGKSGLSIGTPEPLISPDYWREKQEYIRLTSLLRPVAFVIHNQSSTLVQGVRVEIIGSSSGGITVRDKLPDEPAYRLIDVIRPDIYAARLSLQREHLSDAMSRNTQRASMREYDKR